MEWGEGGRGEGLPSSDSRIGHAVRYLNLLCPAHVCRIGPHIALYPASFTWTYHRSELKNNIFINNKKDLIYVLHIMSRKVKNLFTKTRGGPDFYTL